MVAPGGRSGRITGRSELVLSGVIRIVTNRRAFRQPSSLDEALSFAAVLLDRPNCIVVSPGVRHWGIFRPLVA
jgi:predicted nucleic acid-binding protein